MFPPHFRSRPVYVADAIPGMIVANTSVSLLVPAPWRPTKRKQSVNANQRTNTTINTTACFGQYATTVANGKTRPESSEKRANEKRTHIVASNQKPSFLPHLTHGTFTHRRSNKNIGPKRLDPCDTRRRAFRLSMDSLFVLRGKQ